MLNNSIFLRALNHIEKSGFLLTFPVQNQPNPQSLWFKMHPDTPLRWEWDESGDGRVFEMWRLREELAKSRQVVYGKFYQGRATFFSLEMFTEFLCLTNAHETSSLPREAQKILDCLDLDSPLSTKQLKEASGLKGKMFDSYFQKSLKSLWQKGLIVGVGEIDDGAFPSLAHASTKTYYEEIWNKASELDPIDIMIKWSELPDSNFLLNWLEKIIS